MSLRSAVAGAAVVIAASVALTGSTAPALAAPASVPTLSQSDYLSTIKGLMVGRGGVTRTDAEYVASGKSVCADLSAGETWSDAVKTVRSIDGDLTFYRAAFVASVGAFCPENIDALSR